jgi:hypothetical protein
MQPIEKIIEAEGYHWGNAVAEELLRFCRTRLSTAVALYHPAFP